MCSRFCLRGKIDTGMATFVENVSAGGLVIAVCLCAGKILHTAARQKKCQPSENMNSQEDLSLVLALVQTRSFTLHKSLQTPKPCFSVILTLQSHPW